MFAPVFAIPPEFVLTPVSDPDEEWQHDIFTAEHEDHRFVFKPCSREEATEERQQDILLRLQEKRTRFEEYYSEALSHEKEPDPPTRRQGSASLCYSHK